LICCCIGGGGEGALIGSDDVVEGDFDTCGDGDLIGFSLDFEEDDDEGDFDTCGDGDLIDFSLDFEEDDENDIESSFSLYGIERFIFTFIIGLNR
jgi:hypothetical protein